MRASKLFGLTANGLDMVECVQSIDVGVVWDPNASNSVMLSTDDADTVLALNSRYDDDDSRAVILRWTR